MNYKKLYFAFIEKFKNQEFEKDEYSEVHRIIPRYAGGNDSSDNLVRLTFQQHVFVHKLWAKYTNDIEAWVAYRLMSGVAKNKRLETARLGGIANVKSGHLDRIRHLANTEERQQKLKILQERMIKDGTLLNSVKKANDAWRGSNHTEDYKTAKSQDYKNRFKTDQDYREKILLCQVKGVEVRKENSENLSRFIIENAIRDETYLHKVSNKSKYKFISPEGLIFDSPTYAAKYYGNVEAYIVDNWCKRNQNGWMRIPKTA